MLILETVLGDGLHDGWMDSDGLECFIRPALRLISPYSLRLLNTYLCKVRSSSNPLRPGPRSPV